MVFTRVVAAMIVAALIKAALVPFIDPVHLHREVHGIGSFLEVLGGLYSIVIAFVIYVVWEQFNRVQLGLAQEAAALEDLWRVATFLADHASTTGIRHAVRRYMESTAGDEPRRLAEGQMSPLAEEHFAALCHAVRSVPVQTAKDTVLYEELLHALGRVSDIRDQRLSVSATRIPGTLWSLVMFASCALLAGFLLLGIRSFVLSIGIVATIAGSLTFLLSVVKDMDNPFTGAWNVSYQPMTVIAARIGMK